MKHVKSIFAFALVGPLSVACAAPTEEEGSGSSEEAAALDEVVETGTVSSAATADEIVVSQRTVNDSKGKPLFKVLAIHPRGTPPPPGLTPDDAAEEGPPA